MTNCPPGEMISRHLDGELEAGEAARLEGHLASCPACRRRAEELGRAGDLLRLTAAENFQPPARLGEIIEEKFFPCRPEVSLGVIECDLSTLAAPPSGLGWAAEQPAVYGSGKYSSGERGYRQSLTGEGIEVAVELFRGAEDGAACRLAISDGEGRPLDGVRLRLERSGKPVWSFLTRPGKGPVIPRLLPGRYRLRIEHGRSYGLILDLR